MSRWFILRTSGGQTLALAASLRSCDIDAWTPARTLRRYMPAKTPSGKRLVEIDAPILPTFVFMRAADDELVRAAQLMEIERLAIADPSPHPRFSIFRYTDRHGRKLAPFVGDREVLGLQEEEEAQAALIKAMRDAESRAEAEAIRRAAMKSASARRRAEQALERQERARLRSHQPTIKPGTPVEVTGAPAFVGVVGIMEGTDGHYARVLFGNHSFKIEGWQVMPSVDQAPEGIAA